MSDSITKQIISAIPVSWDEQAPSVLGCASTLSLLSARDVASDGMTAALALAMTWSTAFAVSCAGAASGVLLCLFKSDESEAIDRLAKQPGDGLSRPGGRALIDSVMESAAASLKISSQTVVFSPAVYIDLTIDETRLAALVKDSAHIGTFTLLVGSEINSQALVLYAPNGSLEKGAEVKPTADASATVENRPATNSAQQTGNSGPQVAGTKAGAQKRNEVAQRNIDRLLDVELDVIVRFGITTVPLRDVVRMGVGTMIELNRAVDEPVELLVNGRPLARGEVVVVDGYYGVRITEIGPASERAEAIA
jgi:flagellar motor switch protein FliN/FliY